MVVTPDLKAFTFTGESVITLHVEAATAEIVFNAADMTIDKAVIADDTGTELVGTVTLDEANERATVRFDGIAGQGMWKLKLSFAGILNDKLKGFYRSTYKDPSGVEQVIATSKFEPCDARRAFPCWDEPAFKAFYNITLVIDEELEAISNSPVKEVTKVAGGKKSVEFERTIKMSTYLVAFRVGKFDASDPVYTKYGVPIRVWCVPGKKHLSGFALQAAKFTIDWFADYFQVPYAGAKLDLIAIPDFASGAMEDFACISFRETLLLVDKKTASHAELERVAEVVAHENAHMWFGDYVTMSWWNGLWLNEAFATFMALLAVDAWKPEWKTFEGFNVSRSGAMRIDALHATRPIEFAVSNPAEARGMFDVLTYQKGSAILRQLQLTMGEAAFRKGIVQFLDQRAFANADTPELWEALEQAGRDYGLGFDVTEMMNGWVFQAGFPVVTISQSTVDGAVVLKQRCFKYRDSGQGLWHVPVTLRARTAGGIVTKTHIFKGKKETVFLGQDLEYVVGNAGGYGFYRVEYDAALRTMLAANLSELSAGERFNLVGDTWASVLAGDTPLTVYLETVGTLTSSFGELDDNVWTVIVGSLAYIRRVLPFDNDQVQADYLSMVQGIVLPTIERLTWEPKAGETPQLALLRASLIGLLGACGDKDVAKWAGKLYDALLADKRQVNSNLVGEVIETMAANGDAQLYDSFLSRLKDSALTGQEQSRYMYALARFPQAELLERTLAACMDGTIRTQDAPHVILRAFMLPRHSRRVWQFVQDNWEKMVAAWPMQSMPRLCEGVTALVDTQLESEVKSFFASHPVKAGDKQVAQFIELLGIAVRFGEGARGELWFLKSPSA
jgi:puromycin-sensitive aminopeptidase